MSDEIIKDKAGFTTTAQNFFETLFAKAIENRQGQIELRIFQNQKPFPNFYISIEEAVKDAYNYCNSHAEVYFGVNPRTGAAGKKENIQYLTAFHVDLDYGATGHKKTTIHQNRDQAVNAIKNFPQKPTWVNHSGGGFHCYWILETPIMCDRADWSYYESINKGLSQKIGGDPGTQNIDRILRVPGTFNFKDPKNPKEVEVVLCDGPKYRLEDLKIYAETTNDKPIKKVTSQIPPTTNSGSIDINSLPASQKIKDLILHGNKGKYQSRSEADQAVISSLVKSNFNAQQIKEIFEEYPIGSKYKSHNAPEKYLQKAIEKAKTYLDLTDEEIENPLFISGSIEKKDKKHSLSIVKFQEYMAKKYNLRFSENHGAFFQYDQGCYIKLDQNKLNFLCQYELGKYREHFTPRKLQEFAHFGAGGTLIKKEKIAADFLRYLPMQNGLFDLIEEKLIDHTPDIFTTQMLPYKYDANSLCPRFLQFLKEIFMNDQNQIDFVQEAVGYIFHKAVPVPMLFLLYGQGSNGKSVFLEILRNLFGAENYSNISLGDLNDDKYTSTLEDKMLNISFETPNIKESNTDKIKAIVAGDSVVARELYKSPRSIKPYAKHFFAMNKLPKNSDLSHGMMRRLQIIKFDRIFTVEESDVYMTEKLIKELSGIFNWAKEGYKRLKEKNFIFTQVKSMEDSKKNYEATNDSVYAFAQKHLKDEKGSRVKFSEVYDRYLSYCNEEGIIHPYKKLTFKEKLMDRYDIKSSTKDNNQVTVFEISLSN